jgi:hypothetical protein
MPALRVYAFAFMIFDNNYRNNIQKRIEASGKWRPLNHRQEHTHTPETKG